jgi:chorismate-pyruvate lyase
MDYLEPELRSWMLASGALRFLLTVSDGEVTVEPERA